jgi:hypothetical protein
VWSGCEPRIQRRNRSQWGGSRGLGRGLDPDGRRHPQGAGKPRTEIPRTSRVHHLRKAACLIDTGLHRMQILASFEPSKFRSEGHRCMRHRSRSGAAPARPPTAPMSPTIDRDGLPSVALPHAGERIFMQYHHIELSAFGRGTWLPGVFGPQNAGYAGFCKRISQNTPSTHFGEYRQEEGRGP